MANTTLETAVIDLVKGFNEDVGDAMMNLAFTGFLCSSGIQYVLDKTLLF